MLSALNINCVFDSFLFGCRIYYLLSLKGNPSQTLAMITNQDSFHIFSKFSHAGSQRKNNGEVVFQPQINMDICLEEVLKKVYAQENKFCHIK